MLFALAIAVATPARGQTHAGGINAMPQVARVLQQMMAKLKSTTGAQFNKAYVMAMAKSQAHMLRHAQAQQLNQPKLMGLIGKLIPILQQHVELAHHLQRRMTT